ncbi:MAG: hypothetical protein NPIRA02_29550 [Nitrospirales bacterium]|nr:MAG: hypothetical protein NPIRA02_29550 [Nitrospirales bacterium]
MESIREQIMQNWAETIQSIYVENGYRTDIGLVERFHLGTMSQNRNVTIQVQQGTETAIDAPIGIEGRRLSIHTTIRVRHDYCEDGLSTDTVFNRLEQDLYRAVMLDVCRGLPDYVQDTVFQSSESIELDEDGTQGEKTILFDVVYRHRLGDMTS